VTTLHRDDEHYRQCPWQSIGNTGVAQHTVVQQLGLGDLLKLLNISEVHVLRLASSRTALDRAIVLRLVTYRGQRAVSSPH